jgi:hypothetical protein
MEEKTTGTPETGCFYCHTARPFFAHIWSEATRDHFRTSRIEFLKGMRSIIDNRIAHLSRKREEQAGGTRVTVE